KGPAPPTRPPTPPPPVVHQPSPLATRSERLEKIREELKQLHEALIADTVDIRLLQEFRDGVDYARQIAWAIEQWLHLEAQKRDPFQVMPQLDEERVKHTNRLARRLSVDIDATEVGQHTTGLEELYAAVEDLRTRLARLLKKETQKDKGGPRVMLRNP